MGRRCRSWRKPRASLGRCRTSESLEYCNGRVSRSNRQAGPLDLAGRDLSAGHDRSISRRWREWVRGRSLCEVRREEPAHCLPLGPRRRPSDSHLYHAVQQLLREWPDCRRCPGLESLHSVRSTWPATFASGSGTRRLPGPAAMFSAVHGQRSRTFLSDPEARSPFDRSHENGFRIAQYLDSEPLHDGLTGPISPPHATIRTNNRYPTRSFAPSRAFSPSIRNRSIRVQNRWTRAQRAGLKEKVSFTAAYRQRTGSRVLFLPKNARPPYQTVVYFPGPMRLSRKQPRLSRLTCSIS